MSSCFRRVYFKYVRLCVEGTYSTVEACAADAAAEDKGYIAKAIACLLAYSTGSSRGKSAITGLTSNLNLLK